MRKMGSFVYWSCLFQELWSLKCQTWLIFCIFCWIQQKISRSLSKIFKCIWKVLFSSFRKYYGLLSSELPLGRCQNLKIQDFGIPLLFHFYRQYLTNGSVQSLLTIPFSARTQKDLPGVLKYIAQTVTNQQKIQKIANFDIWKTITLGVNMINRQVTHFSHLPFELCPLVYFISVFQDFQNSVLWGSPLHEVLVCKIHIHMPKKTLLSLLT